MYTFRDIRIDILSEQHRLNFTSDLSSKLSLNTQTLVDEHFDESSSRDEIYQPRYREHRLAPENVMPDR